MNLGDVIQPLTQTSGCHPHAYPPAPSASCPLPLPPVLTAPSFHYRHTLRPLAVTTAGRRPPLPGPQAVEQGDGLSAMRGVCPWICGPNPQIGLRQMALPHLPGFQRAAHPCSFLLRPPSAHPQSRLLTLPHPSWRKEEPPDQNLPVVSP